MGTDNLVSDRWYYSAHQLVRMDLCEPECDPLAYAEKRDDALVRIKQGSTAARFHVRPATTFDVQRIESTGSSEMKALAAFVLCCTEVSDAMIDGVLLRLKPTRPSAIGKRQVLVWNEEPGGELDDLVGYFGLQVIYEIGSLIYDRAILGKGLSGPLRFAVPLSLLRAEAARRDALHAVSPPES